MAGAGSPQIYCFKCRSKTDSKEVEQVVLKNGRAAVKCVCADCGGKKFRFGTLG